jgi:ADP-ribose pyrophosphatase
VTLETEETVEVVTTQETRQVYRNRWMVVHEDIVSFANGGHGIFGVVDKPDFSVIVALSGDRRIQLVRQYRYPVKGSYWELPQGSLENANGASPIEVASAELAEETGILAEALEAVGSFYQGYGYATQRFHIFKATGLKAGPARREASESDMTTAAFSLPQILAMIETGEIKDGVSVAALGFMKLRGLID